MKMIFCMLFCIVACYTMQATAKSIDDFVFDEEALVTDAVEIKREIYSFFPDHSSIFPAFGLNVTYILFLKDQIQITVDLYEVDFRQEVIENLSEHFTILPGDRLKLNFFESPNYGFAPSSFMRINLGVERTHLAMQGYISEEDTKRIRAGAKAGAAVED